MATPLVKEADPPLATIIAEGDPSLAACFLGDYYFGDFTGDYLIDWCMFNTEDDPGGTPITVEADPPFVGAGFFDLVLFDPLLFDVGGLGIDDSPPPVAIMVEADL